jgi:hypothetical protein
VQSDKFDLHQLNFAHCRPLTHFATGLLVEGEPYFYGQYDYSTGKLNFFQGAASPVETVPAPKGPPALKKALVRGLMGAGVGLLALSIVGAVVYRYRSKKWSKLPQQQQQQEEGMALTNKV